MKNNYSIREVLAMTAALTGAGILDMKLLASDTGLPDIDQGDFVRTYRECVNSLKNLSEGLITLKEFQEDMSLMVSDSRQLSLFDKIH